MKKNHVRLLPLFLATFICLNFTACSSDDNDSDKVSTSSAEKQFLGAWNSPSGLPIVFMTQGKMLHFPKKQNRESQKYDVIVGNWNYNEQTGILATDFENYQWQVTMVNNESFTGIQLWDQTSGTVRKITGSDNQMSYVAGLIFASRTWDYNGLENNYTFETTSFYKVRCGSDYIQLSYPTEDASNDVITIGRDDDVYKIHHPYDYKNVYLQFPSGTTYHPKK